MNKVWLVTGSASGLAETSRRPYSNPAIDLSPQHATRSDLMTWEKNMATAFARFLWT
jgi:hypothetical protein